MQSCNRRRALTGAWIETTATFPKAPKSVVAPSRARGLKRDLIETNKKLASRRALTGAWIETRSVGTSVKDDRSRALTGAWIETTALFLFAHQSTRRALTGAWIETTDVLFRLILTESRALTGAWIETCAGSTPEMNLTSRPHGRVD